MNRRNFLRIAGSTAVIVGAGVVGFASTRRPQAALQPWDVDASRYPDPIRRALSYAILAPNPHNRQPWLVKLTSETAAVLYCDLDRLLPETDPFDRQIVIGLGCFLEGFDLAARQEGYRANIELFPGGEPGERLDDRPIARLTLKQEPGLRADPLFHQILQRRTNRQAYDLARPVVSADLGAVVASAASGVVVDYSNGGERLDTLRQLARDALRGEILDPTAYGESIELMRIGRREIENSPDGIYIGGVFLETLAMVGMISREELADPNSASFQIGLDMADEQALTATGFVWVNTMGNGRRQQIDAGRSYFRVALAAVARGLAMQPMSQALQEYAAMRPYYEAAHATLVGTSGERVQMLARVGYASPVDVSPRWPLDTRLGRS